MERPDLDRIKQGVFALSNSGKSNQIVQDFEAVLIYALQLEGKVSAQKETIFEMNRRSEELLDERDEARKMLGECFTFSGADPDGDGWEHNWPHAVQKVLELRQNYDAEIKSHDEALKELQNTQVRERDALGAKRVTERERDTLQMRLVSVHERNMENNEEIAHLRRIRDLADQLRTWLVSPDEMASEIREVRAEFDRLIHGGS